VLAPPALARPDAPARTAISRATALERPVLAQINRVRRAHGMRGLSFSIKLGSAASAHSRSMARLGYFTHESADGSSPFRRIARYYHGSRLGETLLWRYPDLTPEQTVALWLSSPPHRAILLNPAFRELGVSAVHALDAQGAFGGHDVYLVVADFGAP
jgi:uncharacterized protein YkwD